MTGRLTGRRAAALRPRALAALACLALWACRAGAVAAPSPLVLERVIPLAQASGRIDHLAIDPLHHRLFAAELGAGAVEVLDLASGRSLGRVTGLSHPQGVGYLPAQDELVVATGGDGAVRFYRAADLALVDRLQLGVDADNVRVDAQAGRLLVAYGGALAVIDPATRRVSATIPLAAHPEGFQVEGARAFVNLPDADAVVTLDLQGRRELAHWRNPGAHFNFPLALDAASDQVAVIYRLPARLLLFMAGSGELKQRLSTCGDADDAFVDAPGRRLYVVCGEGAVDVFERVGAGYALAGRVATRGGARTGLYAAGPDRLYVAARARGGESAAILVYRPN